MPRVDFFDVLTHDDPEPRWVTKDMLTRGAMVILAGEPGVGKSVLSYTWAMSVALGLPFLGHDCDPTPVLYIDEENSRPDFRQYARWVWRGLGCPDVGKVNEALRVEHLSIRGQWQPVLRDAAKAHRPGLIVIDTATTVLQIEDENDNAEASLVTRHLRDIQTQADNDTALIILKHARVIEEPGKKVRRTIRGAKAWLGNVDAVWYQYPAQVGRARKDGLRATVLEPDKIRAYGLRHGVRITPEWTTETPGTPKGLVLRGASNLASA